AAPEHHSLRLDRSHRYLLARRAVGTGSGTTAPSGDCIPAPAITRPLPPIRLVSNLLLNRVECISAISLQIAGFRRARWSLRTPRDLTKHRLNGVWHRPVDDGVRKADH